MQASQADIEKRRDPDAIQTLYRPDNVIDWLAAQSDLTAYSLPADVEASIAERRARAARPQ